MIVRSTLEPAEAEGGRFDRAKFESFTDADIERMIDEDPDLAPRTETLPPYFEVHEIREKLGLTPAQFAARLSVPRATVGAWERDGTPADPVLQALLRIPDRVPEAALRALQWAAK